MTSAATGESPMTAPIAVLSQRLRLRDVFLTLRVRNFRMFIISAEAGSIASWVSRIGIDWLALELTGNLALVGLVVALQLAPTLLIGLWSGILADRYRRKNILLLAQTISMVTFAGIGLAAVLGVAQLWMVFTAVVLLGAATTIDGPSRLALLPEIVGAARLRPAMSLNAMTFHGGGLFAPGVAGLVIAAAGSGWALVIASVMMIGNLVALSMVRQSELIVVARSEERRGGQVQEAIRYGTGKPTILWPVVLMTAMSAFAMTFPVLFSTAASDRGFDTGAVGYGLYTTLGAVGSFIGALLATRLSTLRLRTLVIGTIIYGAVTVVGGVVPMYVLFLGALLGLGMSRLPVVLAAEAMIQLSTNPRIRGRVMALYLILLTGGQSLGMLLVGWVAEVFGMMGAYLVAGGIPILVAVGVAIVLGHRHQLTIQVNLRTPRRIVRIVPRRQIVPEL
jgi:MFS family permease